MNEYGIPNKLMEYLDLLSTNSRYVLSFSPFFINHFSAHLMSYLINIKKKSVLYICVGRPHIFIQKLLQNREVPIRSIHFMDLVLGSTIQSMNRRRPQLYLNEGGQELNIPHVFKLYKIDQEIVSLSLDEVDLVVLDNISELRTYSNDERVTHVISLLNHIYENSSKGLVVLHINNRPDDGMEELSRENDLEMVNIPNDVFS
jgi:hypothetical protein